MTIVGATPYITPDVLEAEPTGISWATIPNKGATPQQKLAAQWNICHTATAEVDLCTQVPMRATINTETVFAPGDSFRTQILPTGISRLILSRPPVVKVLSATWATTNVFPAVTTPIAADQFKVEYPLLDVYGTSAPAAGGDSGGQSVLLAPGYVSTSHLRRSVELSITYLNGWPHGSLTADATAGATSVHVDDVCGWDDATGVIRDPWNQEAAHVSSVTPDTAGALNGPGTLTLSEPLSYAHSANTLFTTLPYNVIEAAILYATAKALTRGTTAIVAQTMGGREVGTSGKVDTLIQEAEEKLVAYKRIL